MPAIITLPGIGGSGEAHWQTHWEQADSRFSRFVPSSWDAPDRDDWIAALDRAVASSLAPPLLVAHSLACLLVAQWAAATPSAGERVRGALLVAVPDPEGEAFPRVEAATFVDVPPARLPFPALVVASTDDPYGSVGYARARADAWGAGFVSVGPRGHINGSSGLGAWPEGAALLAAFEAGLGGR